MGWIIKFKLIDGSALWTKSDFQYPSQEILNNTLNRINKKAKKYGGIKESLIYDQEKDSELNHNFHLLIK